MTTIKHLDREKFSRDEFGDRYRITLSDGRTGTISDETIMGMFSDFRSLIPPSLTSLQGREWKEKFFMNRDSDYEKIF